MSNPPSMAASLPSQPPASAGLSASLLGGGGSDDPSKAALLALDADVVARAAQEHGREAWSQMSWAERLAATKTHAGLGSRKGSTASKLPPAPASRKSSVASLAVSQRSKQSASAARPATPVAADLPTAPAPAAADLLGSARGTPQSRPLSRNASVAGSVAQPPLAPLASQNSHAPTQPPGSSDDLLASPPSPPDSAAAAAQPPLSRRSSKLSRVASSAASAAASLLLSRRPPSVAETTPLDRALDAAPTSPAAATPAPAPATPVAAAAAAASGCAGCDGLRAKVASLEAALKALKKQKAAKGAAAAVSSSAEADALLVQELDLARAALGERTDELTEARAAAAAAEEEAAGLRAQAEGLEDPDVLHAQVWTLEKALELRNEEIHSLRTKLNLFVEQIAELDERLASALRIILESTREEAERNEQGTFGTTADEAVEATAKKRRAKKGKKAGGGGGGGAAAAGARAAALAAEVEGLQRANGVLERRLQEALSGGGSAGGQRDAEVQRLHAQLEQAQQAILSGVDKGQDMRREAERKLKETRKVLKNLLQSPEGGGAGLPAHGSVVVVKPCALDASSPGPLTEQDILTADLPVWSPAALASSPRSPHYSASFTHLSSVPHAPAPAAAARGSVLASPTGVAAAPLSPAEVQAQVERLNLRHMVATQVGGGTCRSVSPTRASVPVRIL